MSQNAAEAKSHFEICYFLRQTIKSHIPSEQMQYTFESVRVAVVVYYWV